MTTAAILASDQVERDRDAEPERSPLMFDPWLTSSHKTVTTVADNLTDAYARMPRKRRMKDRDRENLNAILRTILANLAHATLKAEPPASGLMTFATINAEPPSIGISLRTAKQKLTRYDREGFTGLPAILAKLSARLGVFTLRKSSRKGIASQIVIGPVLAESVYALRFGQQHFAPAEGPRETVYLSRTERDYVDGTVTRELIDYVDTPETERYRAEMDKINAFLAKADLRMEPNDGGPLVVTSIRHLRRHFNLPPDSNEQRFDLGGRLFGGWWQALSRHRRAAIRINGEPIADLDFASMFLRLAYLEASIAPPDGDLYASVPGFSDPRWRDGVKKMVSAMLFRSSPLTKIPRDLREELPPRVSGRRIRSAILAAHPALASVFETGRGLHLMFTESQILVAALLHLIDRGIPALPMHDGLMVAQSKASAAIDAMTEASVQITGGRLPISLKS